VRLRQWNHAIFLFLQIYASGFIACEVIIAAKWLKIKSTGFLQLASCIYYYYDDDAWNYTIFDAVIGGIEPPSSLSPLNYQAPSRSLTYHHSLPN
jgi:hypothetical protein